MLEFVPNFFMQLKNEIENIFRYVFPNICGICGKINENYICEKCKKRIKKFEKYELIDKEILNFNYKIKISVFDKEKDNKNYDDKIYFDNLFYCFEYKGIIRNLLLKYKFSGASYLCYFFANVILNNKKINEIFKLYDIIIPVPMDKNKKLRRGYNQTELIVNIINKNLEINVNTNILKKIKSTKTQSKLNFYERQKNIKNAFLVKNKSLIENKKIILFDDIYTTGATVNEISKILKFAGAKEILILIIAKN